jgi:hypothetical protein
MRMVPLKDYQEVKRGPISGDFRKKFPGEHPYSYFGTF